MIIHNKWNSMSCKICDRYNSEKVCDLNGKQPENKYCKLFIPKDTLSKNIIISMWYSHSQRFIRGKEE